MKVILIARKASDGKRRGNQNIKEKEYILKGGKYKGASCTYLFSPAGSDSEAAPPSNSSLQVLYSLPALTASCQQMAWGSPLPSAPPLLAGPTQGQCPSRGVVPPG